MLYKFLALLLLFASQIYSKQMDSSCDDANIYQALYLFDAEFHFQYRSIFNPIDIHSFDYGSQYYYSIKTLNEKNIIEDDVTILLKYDALWFYFLNERAIDYFNDNYKQIWGKLSPKQKKLINKWCNIKATIYSITPENSDAIISIADVLYRMPDYSFLFRTEHNLNILMREPSILVTPQRSLLEMNLLMHLMKLNEDELNAFFNDYRNIHELLNKTFKLDAREDEIAQDLNQDK